MEKWVASRPRQVGPYRRRHPPSTSTRSDFWTSRRRLGSFMGQPAVAALGCASRGIEKVG